MNNISTEASENVFPWIEICTILLPLGNVSFHNCKAAVLSVQLSYQQSIKLVMSYELVDKLLLEQQWD